MHASRDMLFKWSLTLCYGSFSGSGKSSMMNALFRLEELVGGQISIDGINIADVPLIKLRSVLGIIPVCCLY